MSVQSVYAKSAVLPAKLQLEYEIRKEVSVMLLKKADELFTAETLEDENKRKKADKIFAEYRTRVESIIPRDCFVVNLTFLQPCDVDDFYHDHFRVGPGSLSAALSDLLITDEMRAVVGGEELMVRVEVRYDDYIRVRRRLCTTGLKTSTSVDNLSSSPLHTKETGMCPHLNSLDLATTGNQDSGFTDWVTDPCTKQLVLKMKKTSLTLTGLEAKYEIAQRQVDRQEGMVKGLQREVTRLSQEQETAQKVLLENKKEIEDLTGTTKAMTGTIEELLAVKVKLTNRLAMMEDDGKGQPRKRISEEEHGETMASKQVTSETSTVLMLSDRYGSSSEISVIQRQLTRLLIGAGRKVYYMVLEDTEEGKRCAEADGVELILPFRLPEDPRKPCLDWLTFDHRVRYPRLPQVEGCIVGHADLTSRAAAVIKGERFPQANLGLVIGTIPESTEKYKEEEKAMGIGRKENSILQDVEKADTVFSVGHIIYDHFSNTLRAIPEDRRPTHYLFLPEPPEMFQHTTVEYMETKEWVVLFICGADNLEKLEDCSLAAKSLAVVAERSHNRIRLRIRGVGVDEYKTNMDILQRNINSGKLIPTLLPHGTQKDICRDMQQAHLVLMPSHTGFGLVGLEAMAAGVPILISNRSGLAALVDEVIPEFHHSVVRVEGDDSVDVRNWAGQIEKVLKNSEAEFSRAAALKQKLLESRYWEESHQRFLQACAAEGST